jgi:hypothetical protein
MVGRDFMVNRDVIAVARFAICKSVQPSQTLSSIASRCGRGVAAAIWRQLAAATSLFYHNSSIPEAVSCITELVRFAIIITSRRIEHVRLVEPIRIQSAPLSARGRYSRNLSPAVGVSRRRIRICVFVN